MFSAGEQIKSLLVVSYPESLICTVVTKEAQDTDNLLTEGHGYLELTLQPMKTGVAKEVLSLWLASTLHTLPYAPLCF